MRALSRVHLSINLVDALQKVVNVCFEELKGSAFPKEVAQCGFRSFIDGVFRGCYSKVESTSSLSIQPNLKRSSFEPQLTL